MIIRDLEISEADIAANFFNKWWKTNHIFYRNRDLLKWLYFNNPLARNYSRGLTFKIAFEKEQIIGVFGYVPFTLNNYGVKESGCNLSAWWVHPDHRRGPIGIKLLNSIQHELGFDLCVAGMNTPVAEIIYEKLLWTVQKCIPRWIFPIKKTTLFEVNAIINNRFLDCFDLQSNLDSDQTTLLTEEVDSLNVLAHEGWDKFYWQSIAPNYVGPAREISHLKWRYEAIPMFKYRFIIARDKSEINGMLVFRIETVKNSSENILRIVDMVCSRDAQVPLLKEVIKIAKKINVVFVDIFVNSDIYSDALNSLNFINAVCLETNKYFLPYLFQPISFENLRLNASWKFSKNNINEKLLLMKGDYEFDRPN